VRLLITADLHFNQPKSRALADPLIDEMSRVQADALLLLGDTAPTHDDWLERCLEKFHFNGPKLFVAGNHELWAHGADSYAIFAEHLPRRIGNLGWHWLEGAPFIKDGFGIVGSVGWYDYAFAWPPLEIPRRFYEAKISPGAAERLPGFEALFEHGEDIPPAARQIVARWNDGRFIKLGRSDEAFLDERLASMEAQLSSLNRIHRVVLATHCVPFEALLPPAGRAQWDFARAFLGSPRIGALACRFSNVSHVVCGHSHFPIDCRIGSIRAINIGSGYRQKTYRLIDLEADGGMIEDHVVD
jgi:predicted phosphodiesterase